MILNCFPNERQKFRACPSVDDYGQIVVYSLGIGSVTLSDPAKFEYCSIAIDLRIIIKKQIERFHLGTIL